MSTHVYVIAEAGVNHNGSLERALKLVDAAFEVGADAVKFQSFSADRLVKQRTALVPYQVGSASDHYELLKGLELSEQDQEKVAGYCRALGIEFMSTPYSVHDARFLVSIGVDKIKVASADIIDLLMHDFLASTDLPIIASTGMATQFEVERLTEHYENRGKLSNLWLLQCVSNYPSLIANQNLSVLESYRSLVGDRIGFSDHTKGSVSTIAAIALGARMVEKHLTLDKSLPGPDHAASLDPTEFQEYVGHVRATSAALGSTKKEPVAEELDMRRISRKGVYAKRNLIAGQELTESDVVLLRPGNDQDSWDLLLRLPFIISKDYKLGEPLDAPDDNE
jgi:N,N'-diacetyllegionaminate synthase